ncbi:MAG: capsular biosynthesis protein [Tsuneonella sp.]
MTEQSKIPLPEDEDAASRSSLFERASGAFGLGFRPAPMPTRLDEPPMKRARPVRRAAQGEPAPASVAEAVAPAEAALPVPVTPPAAARTIEQEVAVHFRGAKHPVDRAHLREQGLIAPDGGVSALVEEFRIVKRELLSAAHERGTAASRRILVCSPHPGEGKTFCAVNLAISMASERDGEVLLVDADFAKPSILSALGLPKAPGFMDVLANPDLKPEELVMGTDIPGLWVLPAGNMTNADSEYLASSRTAEVLDRLTAGAPNRMVIFDSPPALAASPAAELAKHVGQAVLIARADHTGQAALDDAVQLLCACADIKLLLNAAHFSPSGRRFGTYYGYEG